MIVNEKYIFWDWNGTLLDDTSICLEAMNHMLAKRNMSAIGLQYYKEVFGFPVIDYYRSIGFDFNLESFEDLSVEFINLYNEHSSVAELMPYTKEILETFIQAGKKNVILSAMQQNMLNELVYQKGIRNYFTQILGIDNIYAHSKSNIGLEFVRKENIFPGEIVFIGDTLHDFEVATELNCRCILIANGHQSEERLRSTGAEVVKSLSELFPA